MMKKSKLNGGKNMNIWIITAIIVGTLVITGAFVVANVVEPEQQEIIDCNTCGNACTIQKNCGQASCGARTGSSCGCGG